jgi:hypothetical protein
MPFHWPALCRSRSLPFASTGLTSLRVRLFRYGVAVAVLSAVPIRAGGAQTSTATAVILPSEGSRVRVQQHLGGGLPPKRITGTYVTTTADSLHIVPQVGDTLVLAISSLDFLDVSLGRRRKVLSSVGAGTLIGGSTLALVSALSNSDPGCSSDEYCLFEFSRSDAALLGGILGAVAGAIVGGMVGALRNVDHWQRVPLSTLGDRVSIRPQLSRAKGVSVRLSF